ncbi:TolC family protein [Treponema primitia]|uniref:TolC family protein n=1 Tax=Treponema primitia TaxID=88058 RepID=UPI003980C396
MKYRFTLTILLLAFTINNSITAEQIDIEDVRALALANSPSLAKFQLAVESARLDEKTRVYSNLPSLSLGASASGQVWGETSLRDSMRTGASFSVSQKLFDGGKSIYLKAINAINTELTRQEALAAYFTVLDTADSMYYETLKAAAALETAAASMETAALALSMAELRLESGMISQGDYLKALADQGQKETARNRALRDLTVNRANLKNITGLWEIPELAGIDFNVYEDTIRFLSTLAEEKIVLLADDFSNAVKRNNPGLLKTGLQLQIAERNVGLAKKDYLPSLSAGISTGVNYSTPGGLSNSGGSISINGSIPLDYWVIGTAVEKKRIAQTEAALNYRDAENTLAMDIQTALLDLIASTLTVQSARRADEYAQRNYEYNLELYKLSQASVFALSDAAALAGDSHTQRITAEYSFLSGLSKLRSLGAFDSLDEVINLLLQKQKGL